MTKEVLYFGYGTNRSTEMMKALVGRKPKGVTAVLKDYELCIEKWEEIPKSIQRILGVYWNSKFRSYCIRPAKGKIVLGKAWILTKSERKLIGNWELTGLWYKSVTVFIKTLGGKMMKAKTDIRTSKKIKQLVNGKNYRMFLDRKEKMLEVARQVRENTLKE